MLYDNLFLPEFEYSVPVAREIFADGVLVHHSCYTCPLL